MIQPLSQCPPKTFAGRLAALALAGLAAPCLADAGKVDVFYLSHTQQYGYMNEQAQLVLAPVFERAGPFDASAMARVNSHGKYGFIDRQGNWIVAARFDDVNGFAPNGLAAAYGEQTTLQAKIQSILRTRKAWGFIDRKGAWVIAPHFLWAGDFGAGGVAPVRDAGGDYGLIDASGAWVAAPAFGDIGRFGAHGLAPARHRAAPGTPAREPSLYGYIDAAGAWIIAPAFESAQPFAAKGLARVSQHGKTGYIDLKGRWAVAPMYGRGSDFAPNGLAAVATASGKWAYIDASGKTVIPASFLLAADFGPNGLATVLTATGCGVIDATGKWILPPRFSMIGRPGDGANFGVHGLASVVDGGKDRVLNLQGEFMPAFDRYNSGRLDAYEKELERMRQLAARNGYDLRLDSPHMKGMMAVGVVWAICWYLLMPLALIGLVFGLPLYLVLRSKKPKEPPLT